MSIEALAKLFTRVNQPPCRDWNGYYPIWWNETIFQKAYILLKTT